MSPLTTVRNRMQIIRALARKGYRDAYVDQHIKRGIATQIRTMREARAWTQAELARRTESKQPHIARLEDEDYGQYSLQTLKRLAAAFDVALVVRFVPFSQLVNYTANIAPADISPVSFDEDAGLRISDLSAISTTNAGRTFAASTPRRGLSTSQLPLALLPDHAVIPIRLDTDSTHASPAVESYELAVAGEYR